MSVYIVMTKGLVTDLSDCEIIGVYSTWREAERWFPKVWKKYRPTPFVGVTQCDKRGMMFDNGTYIRLEDAKTFWKYL